MSGLIDKERLWKDIKRFVEKRIRENHTEMYTNVQRKRFWIKDVNNSYIHIKREHSEREKPEDIPKQDFIDIWEDLHNSKFSKMGYKQSNLQETQGHQNRHTAVSFALISKQPYIEMKKVGNGLRFYLNKTKL